MQIAPQLAALAPGDIIAKNGESSSSTSALSVGMPSSTSDQLMSDLMRPSLSTSLSDFALPSMAPSLLSPSTSVLAMNSLASGSKDDATPLLRRLRRPTLVSYLSESRLHSSPLAMSFSAAAAAANIKGKGRSPVVDVDAGSNADVGDVDNSEAPECLRRFRDRDRTLTGSSSPSSESDVNTPPLRIGSAQMEEISERPKSSPMDMSRSASPATVLKPAIDINEDGLSRSLARRLSCPPKPPRLLHIRAEARPEEVDVKHEAEFQRFLASHPQLPPDLGHNRTSRLPSDRGRYPEEAGGDEEIFQREDTPSDDGDVPDGAPPSFYDYKIQSNSEPIGFMKPSTPAPSVLGTPEDLSTVIMESPGNGHMDIDVPMSCSPSVPPHQWRQTPPPTAAPARTNKRKYEDRFEPYAPSSKRRAVSPSLSQLRDSGALVSPLVIPRSPVLRSRGSFSQSQANSTASSPTVSQSSSLSYGNGNPYYMSYNGSGNGSNGHHRSGSQSSVVSSPTVRASMILGSPILRPIPRLPKRSGDDGEKFIDGAGEVLNSLNLGR